MDWFLYDRGLRPERVKRDSSPKIYPKVTKEIGLLQENASDKLRSLDSNYEQV